MLLPGIEYARLDVTVMARGLTRSRSAAQDLVRKRMVEVNGKIAERVSQLVCDADTITIVGNLCPYVSRGGLKLAAALSQFSVSVKGLKCLDVGASTGGFTDCLLQAGASSVVAVDVGHGQMNPILAADYRVQNREGVNARHLDEADFEGKFDIIVIDVSFISLTLILSAVSSLMVPSGKMIALVKPQFEIGAGKLGKGGIVRSDEDRQAMLLKVIDFAKTACSLASLGTMTSPIEGGDGNVEYLALFESQR